MAVAPISGGDVLGSKVDILSSNLMCLKQEKCTGVRILMDVQGLQWLVPTKSGLKKDNSWMAH